jgi:hypothetical protein
MTDEPSTTRVEVILKSSSSRGQPPRGPAPVARGNGRLFAFAALGLLYLIMLLVFKESFAPRAEWVDSAGRTLLEERPVFWPLVLFAVIGRLAVGLAVWYPDFFDPSRGFFPVRETRAIRHRRILFKVLYGLGLGLAAWTLVNNLALADVYGVARVIAIVLAIVLGVGLLARVAVVSLLSRLGSQMRRP